MANGRGASLLEDRMTAPLYALLSASDLLSALLLWVVALVEEDEEDQV